VSRILLISQVTSRSLSIFLGLSVMVIAASAVIWGGSFNSITHQALDLFGTSFIILLSVLLFMVCFCWIKMVDNKFNKSVRAVWTELAEHAANGTATLALTYTLLGISLGISSLSNQELSSDTIQAVIGGLTKHFSLAFMTTVVGLPISCFLRAVVCVTEANFLAADRAVLEFENPVQRRN